MMLNVFPTSRCIRKFYDGYGDGYLPKSITMDEFEKRVVVVKDKTLADDDKRVLFLNKAASFSRFEELKIPQEYLSFLKSSKFLFGFFEELALEFVDIDDISMVDTYAEYENHLEILKILLENYKKLLGNEGFYDKITLPELYEINYEYLKRFSSIMIYADGYLNSYEMELLSKISKVLNLEIVYQTNIFTKKMMQRFEKLGFDLEYDKLYRLDVSNKKIIESKDMPSFVKEIEFYESSNKLLQIAYIKKKIYDFIKAGIKPEKIVVITPDEEFVKEIEKFDSENIFNFAAGYSFEKSGIYKRLKAFYLYLEERSYENIYRIKRYFENYKEFDKYLFKKFSEVDFDEVMKDFVFESDKNEEVLIYKNELFKFKRVEGELKNVTFKEALYLFLSRLKENRLDDKSGGKITVMGVLESRLMRYEGVIAVDFNEEIVPKKSSKDMFLNTSVRKHASLPTSTDRENLQKNYYHKLFLNAKKVAIGAVSNEDKKPSRFLEEIPVKELKKENFDENYLKDILLKSKKEFMRKFESDLYMEYDFKNFIFSATSFKIFLECKRRFYYQYIKKISEAIIPSNEVNERIIGEKIHLALKILYKQNRVFKSEKELWDKLCLLLNDKNEPVLGFMLDIWKEKLKKFTKNEIKRFEEGYGFYDAEISLDGIVEGVRIRGAIDRIDKRDEAFVLLDYKTGKIDKTTLKNIEKSTNFQMEFYFLLAKQNGYDKIEEAGFYDLNKGEIVKEDLLEEKTLLLKEKFKGLNHKEYNFSMSEDIKNCRYCPYVILCGRDEI